MLFSNRLRWLRNRFGYSQAYLADALSISRMAYTQYESGHREPSLETLIQLASIYNVSLDFMLGLSDLSRMPQHNLDEGYLLSQFDRLTEERRRNVFRVLQHELGEQLLSDVSIHPNVSSVRESLPPRQQDDDIVLPPEERSGGDPAAVSQLSAAGVHTSTVPEKQSVVP